MLLCVFICKLILTSMGQRTTLIPSLLVIVTSLASLSPADSQFMLFNNSKKQEQQSVAVATKP